MARLPLLTRARNRTMAARYARAHRIHLPQRPRPLGRDDPPSYDGLPEQCPVGGGDWADPKTDYATVLKGAKPPFCCAAHEQRYLGAQAREADAYAESLAAEPSRADVQHYLRTGHLPAKPAPRGLHGPQEVYPLLGDSEQIQRYLRLAESARRGMRTNPRCREDYEGWLRLARNARRRARAR